MNYADLKFKMPYAARYRCGLSTSWLSGNLWLLLTGIFWLFGTNSFAQQPQDVNLYYFTNPGCPPCRQVSPGIQTLKQEGYNVTTIVLNENPAWGEKFQVQRVPTVIMVVNQRVVGRHEGVIGAETLREWFAVMGVRPAVASPSARSSSETTGNRAASSSSTMHRGTSIPADEPERIALRGTVRLKVEDQQGASYATGTVVHCHAGEWLVMTCGHAFREAGYRGKITGEYNFGDGEVRAAPAELISYDAGPRDIALVAMQTGEMIEPIKIASPQLLPQVNDSVFSIGCDQGAPPTIRNTQIKNQSLYDGAAKWVIHGRPTIGRSGGGLFNRAGELIGVCNAAMVDADEGVYTSLETVHWQIAQANLSHLFEGQTRLAANGPSPAAPPTPSGERAGPRREGPAKSDLSSMAPLRSNRDHPPVAANAMNSPTLNDQQVPSQHRLVSLQNPDQRAQTSTPDFDDQEVIIIVRSKSDSRVGQSITISDPTPQLLDYLEQIKQQKPEPQELEMARWRK